MVELPGQSLKRTRTRPANVGEGECARHLQVFFEQTRSKASEAADTLTYLPRCLHDTFPAEPSESIFWSIVYSYSRSRSVLWTFRSRVYSVRSPYSLSYRSLSIHVPRASSLVASCKGPLFQLFGGGVVIAL